MSCDEEVVHASLCVYKVVKFYVSGWADVVKIAHQVCLETGPGFLEAVASVSRTHGQQKLDYCLGELHGTALSEPKDL